MKTPPRSLAGLSLVEKRMLLAELLQERASQSASATEFPLSHGQRGLWFLYQMDRQSPAYNVCYPSRIRSPLDLTAFRRAVQTCYGAFRRATETPRVPAGYRGCFLVNSASIPKTRSI